MSENKRLGHMKHCLCGICVERRWQKANISRSYVPEQKLCATDDGSKVNDDDQRIPETKLQENNVNQILPQTTDQSEGSQSQDCDHSDAETLGWEVVDVHQNEYDPPKEEFCILPDLEEICHNLETEKLQ
ncbi:uncharacterized protein LOC110677056 isoform X2 [Aedes aegypti]|uniref:Uncharacterized protein n=1 Tax=Aedes aegypti TaxID=7159 RepID=A0A6I8U400_AEDAE|nr:uncharacterized protein LOC110677056 isoform X2 [Aedes aegypti]